jgi:hypothetical protein
MRNNKGNIINYRLARLENSNKPFLPFQQTGFQVFRSTIAGDKSKTQPDRLLRLVVLRRKPGDKPINEIKF